MTTARQERWIRAAEQAAREGNDVAASLFRLIAQPNDAERAAEQAAPASDPEVSP